MRDLQDAVDAIRSMRIRGAADIGKEAALALARHVGAASDPLAAVQDGARRLLEARPTAVSLRVGVQRVLMAAMHGDDPKAAAMDAGRDHAAKVDAAQDAIPVQALPLLREAPRVLTHCHSSTVVDALVHARREGVAVEATVTETRPWRQGLVTARQLSEGGVPVRFMVDSAVLSTLREGGIDQVLVGADTVTADGALYNKIGTSQVALAARETGVPFRSLTATHKFAPQEFEVEVEHRDVAEVVAEGELPDGIEVHNPVFDRTPPEDVAAYITQDGPVAPEDVKAMADRLYEGWQWM